MDVSIPEDGSIEISMKSYRAEAIKASPDEIITDVATPVAPHLFEVNEDCEKLEEFKRKLQHKIVTKLLYVATKGRPDIYVAIAFLTFRGAVANIND